MLKLIENILTLKNSMRVQSWFEKISWKWSKEFSKRNEAKWNAPVPLICPLNSLMLKTVQFSASWFIFTLFLPIMQSTSLRKLRRKTFSMRHLRNLGWISDVLLTSSFLLQTSKTRYYSIMLRAMYLKFSCESLKDSFWWLPHYSLECN